MIRAIGIDISYWDISFDPAKATKPIDFVIQRTGYGLMVDKCFLTFQEGVMAVPIRGAYHYLSTAAPWKDQAEKFLDLVGGKDYHFLVCDFEGAYNVMSVKFSMEAHQWMSYVQEKSKKPVILYTNPSLYDQYAYHYCLSWPLWIAQYPFVTPNYDTAQPRMPARKKEWIMWQFSADRNGLSSAYGCGAKSVDINVYNGTVDEMRAWLGIGQEVPPPVRERTCPYPVCPVDGK